MTAWKVKGKGNEALPIEIPDQRPESDYGRPEPADELIKIPFFEGDSEKVMLISSKLEEKDELIRLLKNKADLFAWKPTDMPGEDPKGMVHRLNVSTDANPVRQKKRCFAPPQNFFIKAKGS